jgi:DNA-binding NarL/FixJ family response regulator
MEGFALSAIYSSHYLVFDHRADVFCPDLLVIDMTSSITLATLDRLKIRFGDAAIVLWMEEVEPEFAAQAIHLGVRGFLARTLALDQYADCFRTVLGGGLWIPEELIIKLRSIRETNLTPRERQLTMLLLQGLKNREIAGKMGITEATVKVYLSHLFDKVGADDRFELALLALKNMTAFHAAALGNLEARVSRQRASPALNCLDGESGCRNPDTVGNE